MKKLEISFPTLTQGSFESNGKETSLTMNCTPEQNASPGPNKQKIRRLKWLGHMMRLHPGTEAKKAFEEDLRKVKRPQGRPKAKWMQTIRKDLSKIGVDLRMLNISRSITRTVETL